jgi:hypothetical protein
MNGVRVNNPEVQFFRMDNFTTDIENTVISNYVAVKPQLVFVTLPHNDKAKNKPRYENLPKIYNNLQKDYKELQKDYKELQKKKS